MLQCACVRARARSRASACTCVRARASTCAHIRACACLVASFSATLRRRPFRYLPITFPSTSSPICHFEAPSNASLQAIQHSYSAQKKNLQHTARQLTCLLRGLCTILFLLRGHCAPFSRQLVKVQRCQHCRSHLPVNHVKIKPVANKLGLNGVAVDGILPAGPPAFVGGRSIEHHPVHRRC